MSRSTVTKMKIIVRKIRDCGRCTVLAVSNCIGHDSTSYTVLKHVEVEFRCGTSSCDTGTQCSVHRSMSRLSILVLECSKEGHLKGGTRQAEQKYGFFKGLKWMKLAKIFMEQSGPKGRHFPVGFIPQALWHHEQACKNPVSRSRGC